MTSEERGNAAEEERALEVLLHEAEETARAGDFEAAVEKLTRSAEAYPDSPLPHHNLSVLHFARLRRDSEHMEVWEDLSDDEGWFEAAVSEAETALEIDPDFTAARNNLAALFAMRGWYEDALKQWEMSLASDPGQPDVREEMQNARKHLD